MLCSSQYQELYHFGVKGMKWGVRKQQYLAKKDAKETARAKMYYGDGAGVRRRQIKAAVKQRSKDPTYKKAYNEYLSKQDMASHAVKARRERKREDFKNGAKKTFRGVANTLMGKPGRAAGTVALMTTAALAAHKYGIDKMMMDIVKTDFNDARQFVQNLDLRRKVEELLNSKR